MTPYIQDNSMTEQVCNPRALKRNAGRRLKGTDRWIHEDYHHHQAPAMLGHHTFVAAATDNLAPRRPSELRLCGLGTRRATDASLLMVKERRMSCSNSPTLERASPRTLRSLGALKDLVRTCRAMDSPRLDSPTVANLFSDVATMDPGAHRSIVRSLSGEGHDTKHLQVCVYVCVCVCVRVCIMWLWVMKVQRMLRDSVYICVPMSKHQYTLGGSHCTLH